MMRQRRLHPGRVLLALGVMIALCLSAPLALAKPLKVGHDMWIGYAGVFIAEAKGYFKEEGVEVELVPFSGPGDSLPALLAGHLDANLTTVYNLLMVADQAKADPVAVIYMIDASYGADAVVAKTSIPDVTSLKGKKVGVTFNEVNHLLLMVALSKAGVDESDVQLVNVSADDAGAAFLAGSIDAAVTWEPWVSRATSGGAGHVVYSTLDAPDLIMDTLVAPKSTREKRTDELKAFIRATDRGVALIKSSPEEAKAILARKLEASPEDVAGMLAGDRLYTLEANKTSLADTASEPGTVSRLIVMISKFLVDKGLIAAPVEPKGLVDPSIVAAIE